LHDCLHDVGDRKSKSNPHHPLFFFFYFRGMTFTLIFFLWSLQTELSSLYFFPLFSFGDNPLYFLSSPSRIPFSLSSKSIILDLGLLTPLSQCSPQLQQWQSPSPPLVPYLTEHSALNSLSLGLVLSFHRPLPSYYVINPGPPLSSSSPIWNCRDSIESPDRATPLTHHRLDLRVARLVTCSRLGKVVQRSHLFIAALNKLGTILLDLLFSRLCGSCVRLNPALLCLAVVEPCVWFVWLCLFIFIFTATPS
jgi:hypothetical protein